MQTQDEKKHMPPNEIKDGHHRSHHSDNKIGNLFINKV